MSTTIKRRPRYVPAAQHRCRCGRELKRFWWFCPDCGRARIWGDDGAVTGATCDSCGWVISPKFSHCPWCSADVYTEGESSDTPVKRPKGFSLPYKCDARCGGNIAYPMAYCPWCAYEQSWVGEDDMEGECPHCHRGIDDWMDTCPWCGEDATGQTLIPRTLQEVRRLLKVTGIRDWGYRVVLRPGVSGVDPAAPKIVNLERRYVTDTKSRDEIPWSMLVGLLTHELGHSFLYHHWTWTRTPRFRRTFGEVSKAYRVADSAWVSFERRRVATTLVNFVTTYASRHPEEDFAETFRFYVIRRGRLRGLLSEFGRKRKGVVLYEKFLALHDYVRYLRARR